MDKRNNETGNRKTMTGINFYKLPSGDKNKIFQEISNNKAIPPSAVEKDWWVVQTLALIQTMEVAPHIVFKGGTSLSKAWNIIERFSEDIDLALDKIFFGIGECKTVKQVKKLRSTTRKYIYEEFIPQLEERFSKAQYPDVRVVLNNEDGDNLEPVQILIIYETCTSLSDYTKPEVKIEIGSRSQVEPFTSRQFQSLVGEQFQGKSFADSPIKVQCVNPERTFLDKLFLLHEEFQKPVAEIRINRLSRHLYDIEALMQTEFAEKAIQNKALYNDIIKHRSVYTKISSIDYALHQPKTLNPIPPDAVMNEWKKDYIKMQEQMIYGKSLSFEELIKRIIELKTRINKIDWTRD